MVRSHFRPALLRARLVFAPVPAVVARSGACGGGGANILRRKAVYRVRSSRSRALKLATMGIDPTPRADDTLGGSAEWFAMWYRFRIAFSRLPVGSHRVPASCATVLYVQLSRTLSLSRWKLGVRAVRDSTGIARPSAAAVHVRPDQ